METTIGECPQCKGCDREITAVNFTPDELRLIAKVSCENCGIDYRRVYRWEKNEETKQNEDQN